MKEEYIGNLKKNWKRRGEGLWLFFVDLQEAFDKVNRSLLWKVMEKKGISKPVIERIKEVYEETINIIRCGGEYLQEFWTKDGLQQGCILSPTPFNLYVSDIEEALRKEQVGSIIVGKVKFYTLAYADDIVMVADNEPDMKLLMKRLEKYIVKKKMELNVSKSKVMIFTKRRGRRRKQEWIWKGEKIERVKEFTYLGFRLQENGGMIRHIKERVKKANVIVRQIWGIGERKFRDELNKRMYMFDSLVSSVMLFCLE